MFYSQAWRSPRWTRRKAPPYRYEKMITRNGVTFLRLSSVAMTCGVGNQPDATGRQDGSRSKGRKESLRIG